MDPITIPDWNLACLGVMVFNTEFDIAEINHAPDYKT
jgi:hypothetical protein